MPFTLGNHTAAGSVDSGASVTTSAIDTSAADILIGVQASQEATNPPFTDSKLNGWTPLGASSVVANVTCRVFISINPTRGTGHTFSTIQSGSFASIAVAGFALGGLIVLDVENGAGMSGNPIQGGSITPVTAVDLMIAGLGCGNVTILSIDSGFTIADQVAYSAAQHYGCALAYKIKVDATAENPAWTLGGTVAAGARNIAFRLGIGGSARAVRRRRKAYL